MYHYCFQDFRSDKILDHDKKKPNKDRFNLQEEPCMVQGLKSQQGGSFDPHQTPENEEESVPKMQN